MSRLTRVVWVVLLGTAAGLAPLRAQGERVTRQQLWERSRTWCQQTYAGADYVFSPQTPDTQLDVDCYTTNFAALRKRLGNDERKWPPGGFVSAKVVVLIEAGDADFRARRARAAADAQVLVNDKPALVEVQTGGGGLGVDRLAAKVVWWSDGWLAHFTLAHNLVDTGTNRGQLTAEALALASRLDVALFGGGPGQLPVVFLPGIGGTRLYQGTIAKDFELWPVAAVGDRVRLGLLDDGRTPAAGANVVVGPPIDSAMGTDVYGSFYAAMAAARYREDDLLFSFSYDFRLDADSREAHLDRLDRRIDAVLAKTGRKQVVLIAHSMGGLVARAYLRAKGGRKVAKLITMGTPHLGAPKAWYGLLRGYNFGNRSCNPMLLKELGRNWPGAHNLMPGQPFVHMSDAPDSTWSLSDTYRARFHSVTRQLDWDFWKVAFKKETYSVSKDWPWQLNPALVTRAAATREALGTAAPAGVPTYTIVGCSRMTLSAYQAQAVPESDLKGPFQPHILDAAGKGWWMVPVPGNGDGTVPMWSAACLTGDRRFYVPDQDQDPAEHFLLPSSRRVQTIVKGVLHGYINKPADVPDYNAAEPPEWAPANEEEWRLEFLLACPAHLRVRDAQGRQLGFGADGEVWEQLPNGLCSADADRESIVLRRVTGPLTVQVDGTDSGEFTLWARVRGGGQDRLLTWPHVRTAAGSTAELRLPAPSELLRTPPAFAVPGGTVTPTVGAGTAYPPTGSWVLPTRPSPQPVGPAVVETAPPPLPGTKPPVTPTDTSPLPAATPNALTTARTLVYHQLTAVNESDEIGVANGQEPRLCAMGTRAAMAMEPVRGDAKKRWRIAVVDFDGRGLRVIDTSPREPLVDISADGGTVVSAGGDELRLAPVTGGARLLLRAGELGDLRVTADGRRVFFCLVHDSLVAGASQKLERGVWSIGSDGRDLRQVVGATAVAKLLGIKPTDVGNFYSEERGSALDINDNGSRVVLLTNVAHYTERACVLTATGDGRGLRKVHATKGTLGNVGCSGYGQTIGWVASARQGSPRQGWVSAADGSAARALTAAADGGRSISFSSDGSLVVYGSEAVLYRTDGRGRLGLAPGGNTLGGLLFGGPRLRCLTMSRSARRLTFALSDSRYQLASLELDPFVLGDAPRIVDVRVTPHTAPADNRTTVTVTARIQSAYRVLTNSAFVCFLHDSLLDPTVGYSVYLRDDGKSSGDQRAGDGIFTDATVHAERNAAHGPRQMRIKAEVAGGDGRHHATVVEVASAVTVTGGR